VSFANIFHILLSVKNVEFYFSCLCR
jgi:hypothetical protein